MTRGRPILIILIRTCPKKQFLAEAICPTIKRFWHRFAHEESVVEMATSYPKSWDDPNNLGISMGNFELWRKTRFFRKFGSCKMLNSSKKVEDMLD